jgi:hypothetical protein
MRFLLVLSAAALLSAADVKEFHKTVPLDANGHFSLETYKGSIRVTAWDQAQAQIDARIIADLTGWFNMPVENVDIRVDNSAGDVRVKTDYHHEFMEGNLPSVEYTIHVPRRVALAIKDYKSDSTIEGVEGAVEFDTYKGTAHLNGLKASVRLHTYKGDLRASFVNFAGGHVETYKGTIDLEIPKASKFDIDAKMDRRGELDSDFERIVHSSRDLRRGEYHSSVNGGGAELRVSSYRGEVRLRAVN